MPNLHAVFKIALSPIRLPEFTMAPATTTTPRPSRMPVATIARGWTIVMGIAPCHFQLLEMPLAPMIISNGDCDTIDRTR